GAKTKKGFGNVAQKFLLIFIYSVSDFFFIFNDNCRHILVRNIAIIQGNARRIKKGILRNKKTV
ncbi:hypothetical protein, partial [Enterococcus faecalis]|uniref:hypothetical protein n=1 Tax=Enterococcus faecalis TaxID=1351 RepID=UPI00224399E2